MISEMGKTLEVFLYPQASVTKSFVETSIHHVKVPDFIAKKLRDILIVKIIHILWCN